MSPENKDRMHRPAGTLALHDVVAVPTLGWSTVYEVDKSIPGWIQISYRCLDRPRAYRKTTMVELLLPVHRSFDEW